MPLHDDEVKTIYEKRKDRLRISCIFCERRVGWYDIRSIDQIMRNDRIIMCDQCRNQYSHLFINQETRSVFGDFDG